MIRRRFYGAFFACIVSAFTGLPASAATATPANVPSPAPVTRPPVAVNPAMLPTSTVDFDFAPDQAKIVKAAFATYTSEAIKAGSIYTLATGPVFAKTVTGQNVDLRDIFIKINELENAGVDLQVRSIQPVSLERVKAQAQTPKQLHAVSALLALPAAKATPTPPPAAPSPPPPPPSPSAAPAECTPLPNGGQISLDEAWLEVAAVASGKTATGAATNRCDLAFESRLTEAESGSPKVRGTFAAQLPPIAFGGKYAGGNIATTFSSAYPAAPAADTVELLTTAGAQILGTTIPLLTIDAALHAPSPTGTAPLGKSTGSLRISVGKQSVFDLEKAVDANEEFHLIPDPKTPVNIIPPFRTKALGATFEVDCLATTKLDGRIASSAYGLLVEVSPQMTVELDGGISVSSIFADGRLVGQLTLVNLAGTAGGLLAVVPDRTAAQFDNTAFSVDDPPLVAIARPTAGVTFSALQGSISIEVRIVGNIRVLSVKIPISGGIAQTTRAIPSTWSVTYLARHALVAPAPLPTP